MIEFGESAQPSEYLTQEESAEFERIQSESSVIGYALIDMDGSEILSKGVFDELSGAIFANIFDIADRVGEEFGESESSSMFFAESEDYEIAAITMTRAKAVFIKQKGANITRGLRSVS